MKRKFLAAFLAGSALALTGCGDKGKVVDGVKDKITSAVSSKTTYLNEAAELQKAQDSLKALPQLNGKAVNFFQDIKFYDGAGTARIEIDIQDPAKPENIDNYVYKFSEGKWSEPQPVQISGGGDIKKNVTALDKVRFADVAEKVLPLLKQKTEEEKITPKQATPQLVTFVFWVPNQTRYWQTQVDTDRASYSLRVTPEGKLKSFEKN